MRWTLRGPAIAACAFALAVYAAGLVIMLPATWIDARLEQASRGIVRLADARGSVWSGTGQLEIRDKAARIGNPHHLAWQFQPWSLLRGRLAFVIELDQNGRQIPLSAGWSQVEIENLDILLPAGMLGLTEPKLVPLALGGELTLHITRLSLESGLINGNATLQWRGARSALTVVSPLGDYELTIAGSGSTVGTVMHTLQGPLQIDGKGTWTVGAASAFMAQARVPEALRQQLVPLLNLIAVERSAGIYEIHLK